MLSVRPEEWPVLFTQRLRDGDVKGMAALYDEVARFVLPTGRVLNGIQEVRSQLANLVNAKARMQCVVEQAITMEDVAVLYTNFEGERVDATGQPVRIQQHAIEILRLQPDGTWKLIFGDPWGRDR
jgi:ketosteroid isomerase-like protein